VDSALTRRPNPPLDLHLVCSDIPELLINGLLNSPAQEILLLHVLLYHRQHPPARAISLSQSILSVHTLTQKNRIGYDIATQHSLLSLRIYCFLEEFEVATLPRA